MQASQALIESSPKEINLSPVRLRLGVASSITQGTIASPSEPGFLDLLGYHIDLWGASIILSTSY
jgi:hypothetical protein